METIKRREAEFARVRRELDELRQAHDETLNNLRRRHQSTLTEISSELDVLQRAKAK
ncbi:hypothetical protein FBUS_02264 [Fasciolopsis buskii]|uniref:Uncharacterized protein n=1 Tax=Fasciolopsis buskii TaxID=27845 RepID=A0A8E0S335_9TREM|nr:hypothetical protein FBUS_02264 [Fasciolopsis buski]